MTSPTNPGDADIVGLVRSLTEKQREAWVWTGPAVIESRPNRRAFADGYNGNECDKPATVRKLQWHHRGGIARQHLLDNPS